MKHLKHFWLVVLLITGLHSYAQSTTFDNPIAEQRADPWVYKAKDGNYFFIATVPDYDRIILRKAKTINGLKSAEEKTIWEKHTTGVMGHHIWAPELHRIDGKWYIYFAAGEAEDIWKIRMWVLSNDSEDPMKGAWKEEGQIKTDYDSFSLDATTFEHEGKRYLIWAQNLEGMSGTALKMAEMKNPTTLKGPEIVITRPELDWERVKYHVNEGPAVLKKNGKIFVSYSASATNDNYCIGLLWIDAKAALLDEKNWNKSPGPVFFSNEDYKRFGPGHNSFTTSEDGKETIMIYHARDYKEIEGAELLDPNRATRARAIKWTPNGFPDLLQKQND
ncbi:Beta-xylosidase, GH43 family [Pustulibacterium marinum]|uniref:Beta-xylosidase, GH43 family n=1 Tax=Pustulibacterium marinum TaxID=1224947 RepID=A0A1I7GA95_9FLAO|nr:glycoside hydrolase family 43 protein [Pustulibacterium marinum]SFU45261.1 Beta-xylosidase, GH43 family [Pustulibacterium marinum]